MSGDIKTLFNLSHDPGVYSNDSKFPMTMAGVEVELEGVSIRGRLVYWNKVHDHSLRGGVELVLRRPSCGDTLHSAMRELNEVLTEYSPRLSHRTGVHVHVDVRDRTLDHLRAIVLAYASCESAIVTLAGKHRYDNIYCPGLSSCYSQVRNIGQVLAHPGSSHVAHYIGSTLNKYMGINICPVITQGSVEFRAFTGSTSTKEIQDWTLMITKFVELAADMGKDEVLNMTSNDHVGLVHHLLQGYVTSAALESFDKYAVHNALNCMDMQYYMGDLARSESTDISDLQRRFRGLSPNPFLTGVISQDEVEF